MRRAAKITIVIVGVIALGTFGKIGWNSKPRIPEDSNVVRTVWEEPPKPPGSQPVAPTRIKPPEPPPDTREQQKAKAALAEAISSAGFNCPSVWNLGDRGEDHYGKVFRVRCGPVSGRGTSDQMPQFKVTVHSSGRVRIAPWD